MCTALVLHTSHFELVLMGDNYTRIRDIAVSCMEDIGVNKRVVRQVVGLGNCNPVEGGDAATHAIVLILSSDLPHIDSHSICSLIMAVIADKYSHQLTYALSHEEHLFE